LRIFSPQSPTATSIDPLPPPAFASSRSSWAASRPRFVAIQPQSCPDWQQTDSDLAAIRADDCTVLVYNVPF
jgi:hypothetical protein